MAMKWNKLVIRITDASKVEFLEKHLNNALAPRAN